MKRKALIIPLVMCLLASSLTGCGMSKEEEQVVAMLQNGNPDIVNQSKIVNPYALINSFNTDVDRAVSIFNAQRLAILVYPNEIQQGNIIIPNSDGTQTTKNCLYVKFDEGDYLVEEKAIADYNTKHPSRTSLVCSIDEEYYNMLNYANGTENGTYVENYYLVGSLSSVVGNKQYNLFMNDCKLLPASRLYAVETPETTVQQSQTLDVSSSETITFTLTNQYYGYLDYNKDGFTDVLNVNYQNASTTSSFDKLVNSGILKKITADLNPVAQAIYNDQKIGVKFPYPQVIVGADLVQSAGLDGTDINILRVKLEGKNKTELKYEDNKATMDNAIPMLLKNPLTMESQEALISIGKDGISPFTIKLLDGTEEPSQNSSRVLLNNLEIDALGNITGDIYIKTENPFSHYYKGKLRIVDEKTIEEVVDDTDDIETHNFYDVETFELTDEFKTSTKGFKLKKDIAVAKEKKIFVSYKMDPKKGYLSTGKGTTKDELSVPVIKCNTGDYLNIFSMEKDKDGQYWLDAEYVYKDASDKSYRETVYIPILFNNSVVNSDRQVQIYGTGLTLDDLLYYGE